MLANKNLSKVIAVVVALTVLMVFTMPSESFAASKSKNNYAKSIKVSGGKLDKKFNKKKTSYKIKLTAKQTKSTITFKKAQKKAKVSVKIGAKKWTKYSKKASIKKTIKVANGKTVTVKYRVKAQNGKRKTYTIKITRAKAAPAPKPPTPVAKQNQAALAIKSGGNTVTTLSKQYGDASFALTAAGGSGTGAYSWTSSNPAVATVSGGAVTIGAPGTTTITLNKAGDTNYNAAVAKTLALTVTARNVTISYVKDGTDTKVYDGTANALTALNGTFEINNLKPGDTSDAIDVSKGTATFADANAADDKTVTFAGFSLTGAKASLYKLTAQPAQTTANITKATLGAISVVVNSWTYGEEPDIDVEGVSGNIPVQFLYYSDAGGNTSIGKPTDAGSYYIKATIEGTNNYTGAVSAVAQFSITKADQAELAIKDGGDTVITLTKPYGNFTLTPAGGSGTGAVSWESSNADVATINETSGAITMVGVGETTITLNKAGDGNYDAVDEATLNLTVTYSGFTLDWDAYNSTYSYPTKTVTFADIDESAAGANYDHGSTSEDTQSRIFRARLFKGGTAVDSAATVNWSVEEESGSEGATWNTETTTGTGTNYLNIPADYAGTISVKVSSAANPDYDVTFDIEVYVRPEVATAQRTLIGSTVGDTDSDWLEIATKTVGGNDYSLIVRKTVLTGTTTFGAANNNDYLQADGSSNYLRAKINTWYAGLDSNSILRTKAVTNNAMSRLGTSMINTQDGYSLPSGILAGETTTDIAFPLSSNEVISFLSKTYYTQVGERSEFSSAEAIENWNALAGSAYSWLRSPGISAANASSLNSIGAVAYNRTQSSSSYGGRPALWVSSDIFD
jgi:hypothetical protein